MRSRFIDEIPAELTDQPGTRGPRGVLDRRSRRGPRRGGERGSPRRRARAPARSFRTGDDVVHAAFGEGVVTGLQPGGVVVVRFAGAAPLRKTQRARPPSPPLGR